MKCNCGYSEKVKRKMVKPNIIDILGILIVVFSLIGLLLIMGMCDLNF
jgi:hypothetical protein